MLEQRLEAWHRDTPASQRVAAIPGVGLLGATALVAMMRDPATFRSGREFTSWLGLVPRHRRHGRAGAHAGHLQARGYLSADPADSWCPHGAHPREGADRVGRCG